VACTPFTGSEFVTRNPAESEPLAIFAYCGRVYAGCKTSSHRGSTPLASNTLTVFGIPQIWNREFVTRLSSLKRCIDTP
jgi:hypothetical protein